MLFTNPVLTIVVIVISLCFLLFAVWQVKHGKLLLRYSLIWLFLGGLLLVVALWPTPAFELSSILGFNVGSNFIFLIAVFFLLLIALSHAQAISKQTIQARKLTQRLAILEKCRRDEAAAKDDVLNNKKLFVVGEDDHKG